MAGTINLERELFGDDAELQLKEELDFRRAMLRLSGNYLRKALVVTNLKIHNSRLVLWLR